MRPITKEIYLNWYEEMLFWRKFEDKLASVYIQQKVRGFLHLYNGQEAILASMSHFKTTNSNIVDSMLFPLLSPLTHNCAFQIHVFYSIFPYQRIL